ncbi:hypothetical protein ABIF14_005553 [Bradyrhizobium elkanii]
MSVGHYASAVTGSAVMELLKPFDPRIVGTLPLGLAVPGSDIDIVCHASDPNAFADIVWAHYQACDDFVLFRWTSGTRPVIAALCATAGRSNCSVINVRWSSNEAGSTSRSNGGCLRLIMDGCGEPSAS